MSSDITNSTLNIEINVIEQEEQKIGFFFAACAIQLYLHKMMFGTKIPKPLFLKFYTDLELSASQRVFIHQIITNSDYKSTLDEIVFLFKECGDSKLKQPQQLLLSRINKETLIKQIFNHTNHRWEKLNFIESFLNIPISSINLKLLDAKMLLLSTEQKIVILARIFAQLEDSHAEKRKTLIKSFSENMEKIRQQLANNSIQMSDADLENIKGYAEFIKEYI